jgi:type II restriction/modification system DNA methylase subunit YeeA
MTPEHFLRKWQGAEIGERQAAQSHFIDLCHLLGQPTPTDADPKGEWYCFEKGASKVGGGEGWADVWKREFFGWEYKGKGRNLDAAFAQLQRYAPALENPPLLIVSDMDRIRVHTNWTNTVPKVYDVPLNRIAEPDSLYVLRSAFTDPEKLKPDVTREQVTKEAATQFAQLAQRLRDRGEDAHRVAHFLNRMMFCLFAEDSDLLPTKLFTRALATSKRHPEQTAAMLRRLFGAMHKGGLFGADVIEWFNGGLFDSDDALDLRSADVDDILEVSKLDWSSVEPSIFGTLFERGLDPSKRSQLGAHYTDPQSIMRIVNPVIVEPLAEEWQAARGKIADALQKASDAKSQSARSKAHKEAQQVYQAFLHRLAKYRVLDPACGSGNFLYLALQSLKDIEHRASLGKV